ncbi:hypothetical protein Ahy_B05g074551 [Arachis hypogaea]|uniref:Uncharacterized protein n=1 Tax=Arachis hypogaea TaxID=3818 RepID=A0A444YZ79_ARAHY|nr:hypothetical protein Ahy_B05g074551 [Arachis hypogaea]
MKEFANLQVLGGHQNALKEKRIKKKRLQLQEAGFANREGGRAMALTVLGFCEEGEKWWWSSRMELNRDGGDGDGGSEKKGKRRRMRSLAGDDEGGG